VSDAIARATASVNVVVANVNHAPTADAGVDQVRQEGSVVTLDGGRSSDPDGDALLYAWRQVSGPSVVLAGPATAAPSFTAPAVEASGAGLVFELTVDDGLGRTASDQVTVVVQNVNDAPRCERERPTVATLWPPDHKLVAVGITGVRDPNRDPVTITIETVRQDEPVTGLGDGDTSPDAVLRGAGVLLRAERSGGGDGRVYHVTFRAEDGQGGLCRGEVTVEVPHNRKSGAVDGGALYDSTVR
jgi:hypothetical protein